ncbi:hypothetical protein [Actinopolymorpha rutila]|uniref:FtsX-like permease family protein n=1 Tax=Actinopolymorpha rutila TaxID=446787 RepID=A0A852ZM62_9ACTN|nr:hypothetical protein [Actinopolymorpha rutila]NYH93215.1 hypothetical protein [Actinopolymorpha rutila]
MWAVLRGALGARRGPAIVVMLVALLAGAAVTAAPFYAVKAQQQVGVAAVGSAPVEQRLVQVSWLSAWRGTSDTASESAMKDARKAFRPPGFATINGAFAPGGVRLAGSKSSAAVVKVAYRDDVFRHLTVTGNRPTAAGQVVLPAAFASQLSLKVGDDLSLTGGKKPSRARLVGVYRVTDPSEPYWADGYLVGLGSDDRSKQATAFTVPATMRGWEQTTFTYDLLASPAAFATMNTDGLASQINADLSTLGQQGFSTSITGLDGLLDRISQDRRNVLAGVGVGVVVLLLLTWFALAVVVREAAVQIRGDVGWWRLHGAPSGRGWVLVLGQSVVPLVGGAVVGAAAGFAVGRAMAGNLDAAGQRTALLLSLLLLGLTLVGGLVAVVAAQVGTLLTPARDLLRRIPVRRPGWRRSLVDVVLVGLSVYGVVQAVVVGGSVEGLPLLAPALVALAVALVAAWGVPPLANSLTLRARQAGRPAMALIAALTARRPETHRLFALVVVAIALVTTAFVGWDTTSRTQVQRAALELGADRVLTVDADDPAQLMAAVRAADPSGKYAMAVVDQPGESTGDPSVLAMDTTRLSVVTGWRKEYGGAPAIVAAALRPSAPHPVTLRTGRLVVDASGQDPGGEPLHLRVRLRTAKDGKPVDAIVGPLTGTRKAYSADVRTCAAGCRLVGVQVLGDRRADGATGSVADPTGVGYEPATAGARVDLYPAGGGSTAGAAGTGVRATDAAVTERSSLPAALLAAPERWRPAVGPRDLGPTIAAGKDSLRLTVSQPPENVPLDRNDWAFVADTPVLLPALVAGWRPDPAEETRLIPLPGAAVPAQIVRTGSLVPRHDKVGTIVDLTYAERLVPFPLAGSGFPQVWLSADAPASVVASLHDHGLTTLREESMSTRLTQLRAEGSAVGVRFQVAVALVGLLLAAGAVLIDAARERPGRAAELAALRAQGVDARAIRAVGYGSLGTLVGTAAVIGLAAGVAGAAVDRILYPGFVDGWNVLPTVDTRGYPVLAAALAAVVVLGTVVVASGSALVRRARP